MVLLSGPGMMAQSTFEVNGTVVDKATGETVIGGSIKLMLLPDSSFVEGTTTGAQGEFNLKNVKKGTYALQVSYVGYATKSISVDLTQQKKKAVNIGYITMAADAIELQGVEVTDKFTGETKVLDVAGLFVAVGQVPENQNFAQLIDLDESGYAIAGEDCLTKVPGIFVAGDNRVKDVRQLITAASDGAVAATAAIKYLNE